MTDDDVPLDITGHDGRRRPSESADGPDGEGTELDGDALTPGDPATNGASKPEASADGDESAQEDDEVEPVEVLVNMADDGEIDPWDIDIVAVTDKFLDRLDEADLRTSGRALFYASVLLRMKGDAMLDDGEDDEEPWDEPWEQPLADDQPLDGPDPFDSLEQEMDRRLERKRTRGMPQTLDELVRDLRDAERDTWWKESRTYDTSESPHGFQRGTQELDYRSGDDLRMDDEPTEADVTGTAHAEDIDAIIDDVEAALREHYEAGREEVLYREIEDAGGSRVETFLGLLFLAHRGRVRLQQDECFGDLWVQDPTAAQGSEEALAD
jgi:segregation and condensation protein A